MVGGGGCNCTGVCSSSSCSATAATGLLQPHFTTTNASRLALPLRLPLPMRPLRLHSAATTTTATITTISNDNKGSVRVWQGDLDADFPSETPEGQARIAFFRKLKKLLKRFAGKHSFHNFASGGACPEESAALRRLDRIFHKDLLSVRNVFFIPISKLELLNC